MVVEASGVSAVRKLLTAVKMTRVYTTHIYVATVVSGALLSGGFDAVKAALMCVSVCAVLFFVNVTNFYTDAEQDKIHPMTRSENPFTNKILDKKDMLVISLFWVGVSVAAAVPMGLLWVLAVLVYNLIAYLYDFGLRMKGKPYGWFLEASLSLPLTFLFPYLVLSPAPSFPVWMVPALTLFYATFAMVVSKDVPDMPADLSAHDRTFPGGFGVGATQKAVGLLSLVALASFVALALSGVISVYSVPVMGLLTAWILRNITPMDRLRDRMSVYGKLCIFGIFMIPSAFLLGVVAKLFYAL